MISKPDHDYLNIKERTDAVVKVLLNAGADTRCTDHDGNTVLDVCLEADRANKDDYKAFIKLLQDHDAVKGQKPQYDIDYQSRIVDTFYRLYRPPAFEHSS
jgi:ankyrin repeat protein